VRVCNWSDWQSRVNDGIAFAAISLQVVGGPAVISDLQCIFINHFFPEGSMPLRLASRITSSAVGVGVFFEDSAAVPEDSLPVKLSCRSLSRWPVSLIVTIDYPRYLLPTSPYVRSNNIVLSTSAYIRPLVNPQTTPLTYRRPNLFSCSYFVCQMADPNFPSLSRWLLQAHDIQRAFDFRFQCRNGPLV